MSEYCMQYIVYTPGQGTHRLFSFDCRKIDFSVRQRSDKIFALKGRYASSDQQTRGFGEDLILYHVHSHYSPAFGLHRMAKARWGFPSQLTGICGYDAPYSIGELRDMAPGLTSLEDERDRDPRPCGVFSVLDVADAVPFRLHSQERWLMD
jgi:hypothetical protein